MSASPGSPSVVRQFRPGPGPRIPILASRCRHAAGSRFAFRLLVKERWFSAVAIVALALGIGLNATVFTLVNAVLIRGLPFEDSQNLYMLAWQHKRGGRNNVSYPEFKEWREQSKAFTGLAGWTNLSMTISDDRGLPEQARGVLPHGERLLGGRPAACSGATSGRRTKSAAPTGPSSSAIASGGTAMPAIPASSGSSPA